MKYSKILTALIIASSFSYAFDLGSLTKSVMDNVNKTSTNTSETSNLSNLSNSTVSSGLKEALKIGVDYATKTLGKENGYLNNNSVKIPLPENLAKVETLIRKAGGNEIADNLIKSMNNAATTAAPKTAQIFVKSIENMSLDDAKKILAGDNNAATKYFQNNTTSSLKEMIKPIVQKTMEENNVAKYYDMANSFYKTNVKSYVDNSSVMGYAKSFGVDSYLPGSSDQNIDEYVTNKAIEGLFLMIAQKESEIRNSTEAQTTNLLKQVFGK